MGQELLNIPLRYKPGDIVSVNPISSLITMKDGRVGQIDQIFGPGFIEQHHSGWEMIHDLMVEINILRKIVKEMMRRDNVQITSANEFHRSITSLANKIGEDPSVLRELFTPYLEELFKQMLEEPKSKGGANQRGRSGSRRNHRSSGGSN